MTPEVRKRLSEIPDIDHLRVPTSDGHMAIVEAEVIGDEMLATTAFKLSRCPPLNGTSSSCFAFGATPCKFLTIWMNCATRSPLPSFVPSL